MKNLENKGSFWDGLDKDSIRYNIYHPKDMKSTPETDAIANEGIVDENSILTYAESLEKDKKLKQRHTILFALLIVGGFIAYKKFKK